MSTKVSGVFAFAMNILIMVIFLFATTPIVALNFLHQLSVSLGIVISPLSPFKF